MYETLVDFRNSKEMSQLEFARQLGISASYLSKIELNQRQPSFSFMRKLKKAFDDVDIDKIFFKNK